MPWKNKQEVQGSAEACSNTRLRSRVRVTRGIEVTFGRCSKFLGLAHRRLRKRSTRTSELARSVSSEELRNPREEAMQIVRSAKRILGTIQSCENEEVDREEETIGRRDQLSQSLPSAKTKMIRPHLEPSILITQVQVFLCLASVLSGSI